MKRESQVSQFHKLTSSSPRFGSRLLPLVLAVAMLAPTAHAQQASKPAAEGTKAANAQLLQELPFNDKTSFELAHKGFIAPLPQEMIKGANGNTIWDPAKYGFVKVR